MHHSPLSFRQVYTDCFMYLGLGSWRLQCFWTWPFVFSNRAFVLDETDYVWSALSSCTTKCQLLHALAYVEMNANNHTQTSQASSNAKPYLCTATCIPMYTHMYVVCEKVCACVCVWRGVSSFSQQYKISTTTITKETLELKFLLTVTPRPLPGTSELCWFLFNNINMFVFSKD